MYTKYGECSQARLDRRPRPEGFADFPLVAERVDEPAESLGRRNRRGRTVTTIARRTGLGLPPIEEEPSTVNSVVRTVDGAVGLVVDRIGHVLEPPAASFEPAPDTVPAAVRELVEQVCKLDDGLLLVLDTERAAGVVAAA